MRARLHLLSGFLGVVCAAAGLTAQTVTLSGGFTGTTLDSGWTVGGTGYTPTLTAPSIDAAGSGWLRLTSAGTNQATYAVNTNSFVSKNATITASFNYVSYGGTGADGITFFLADASKAFAVGSYGGSLGYAQQTTAGGGTANVNGLNGGYIGLGIDEFGNYANNSEGRVGGFDTSTSTLTADAVSVRGPGSGLTGYDYLGGTGTLLTSLDTAGSTRPTATTFQVIITATNQLTVYMDVGATGNFTTLYNIDLSGYARPDSLVMGFTGSTGGSTNIHEVQSVALASVVANLWTNTGADSKWGTASDWYGSPSGAVPSASADVLLDNSYVSSAQTIDVASNRTIRSLQIDAPFTYTLNNGTLTFDRGGIPGPSGIFVSQTHGSATQTVNSALALNNAIQIQNNSAGALALGGAIATSGNAITVNGSGVTTASGVISGTGSLTQGGTGTTTLSGANTYSGGTTISSGTLNANNATALGSAGVTLSGGTLGSTNSSTVANTVTLTGSAGLSGITTSGALTQSGGSYTLSMAGATQSGAVNLSNTTTARTLTVQVDSGTSSITGVIANGGGSTGGSLTKTGTGTLALSGANTYTGTTTITGGTVQLGASNVLADTSSVSIGATGALDLNGNSEKIAGLTAAGGATLDFGSASGANTFVFGTYTAPASGVLVVNNWQTGVDTLATTVASQTVSSIYISGYGVAQEAGSKTDNLYGTGTNGAYLLTPAPATVKEWDGSTDTSWSQKNNWTTTNKPGTTEIAYFNSLGTGRPNVNLDGNNTIAGVRFGTGASVSYNITGTNTLTLSGAVPYIQQQSANNQTLSPTTLQLNNNTVADVTGAGNLTIGSALTGTGNLIKDGTGAGKLILSGTSTAYSAGIFVNNGVLQITSNSALGNTTGTTTISSGAALELNSGSSLSTAEQISLGGSGLSSGGAIRNIAGTNTLSGALTLSTDSRINSDAGTLTLSGAIGGSGKNLTVGGAGSTTITGVIGTGTGGVTKDGAGTLTLGGSSSNTYTGDTTVNAGTLALSQTAGTAVAGDLSVNAGTVNQTAGSQLATTSAITLNGGTYNLEGTGSVTQTIQSLNTASGSTVNLGASDTLTVSGSGISNVNGTITGTGALVTASTGTVYLGGANTYSGGTTIGSVATAANSTALGSGAVTVSSGGNLQVQGGVTLANNFTLNGPGTNANDGAIENFSGNNTLSGNIAIGSSARIQSSSGTLTLSSAGTLTGTGNALTIGGNGDTTVNRSINTSTGGTLTKDGTGTLTLAAANNYTGATTLSAGTTRLTAAGVFSDSAALTLSTGAILNLNANSEMVGSLQGGGAGAGGTIEFGGATLTLASGASSFGGDFGFSNGTIVINSGQSLTLTDSFNASNINIVLNGGSLFLGSGLTQTFGSLTVTGTGTSVIDFGTTGTTTAQFSSVNVTGTGTLAVNNWTDMVDYFLATSSPGAQGTSPTNKVVFAGYVGGNTKWIPFNGGTNGQLSPVPEPSAYGALLLGASAGFIWWRRRR